MFGTFGHQDPFVRQRNAFDQPHTTQTWSTGCTPNVVTTPHTFGLFNSSLQTISQPNAIRLSALQQRQQKPLPFKQQNPAAHPIPFGQTQPAAQTLTFGQQKPFGQTQPIPFGQTQPTCIPFGQQIPFGQAQPIPFGQAQPIPFDQAQPVAHIPFGQAQPVAHIPFRQTQPAAQTLITRIVLVNPLQQNYDHMSGEEYLLLNDLSLSIDYCQKLQRELQIKMNS